MKRVIICLIFLSAVYACTGSTPFSPDYGTTEPDTPYVDDDDEKGDDPVTPEDPEDPEEPAVPDEPAEPSEPSEPETPAEPAEGVLSADGNSAGTYALITGCGYNYETPDTSGAHASEPFQHIQQSFDETLGKYVFDFYIHVDNDDDRGLANVKDRQRNEIKTDGHSPASMVGQTGDTMIFRWKFRLPEGMQTTNKFCHIHQIKGLDNKEGTADVGTPTITYTLRTQSNGKQQFQIIYVGPSVNGKAAENEYLAKADLSDFLGQWVEIEERIVVGTEGSYSTSIKRLSDGKQLVSVKDVAKCIWREGTTGMRPKWGIYRNFGTNGDLKPALRDEILKFADFSVEKVEK